MSLGKIPILLIGFLLLTGCKSIQVAKTDKPTAIQKENFHLYLLIGQSNMAGRGVVESIDTLVHPRVFMLDKGMGWVAAKDPVHFDKSFAGTGLGLTFGKIMANEQEGIKIGLIPCAKGGSSINKWFLDSLHQQTKSYPYNEMLGRAKKAMESGTLKGILWHQGESDLGKTDSLDWYEERFKQLQENIASDLDIEQIPWIIGEVGHFLYENQPSAKTFNQQLKQIANQDEKVGLVTSGGLNHKGDGLHFDSNSYRALGMRYAERMKTLQALQLEESTD